MRNLMLLLAAITLIGGAVLSLLSGSWIMMGVTILFMGCAFVISYLGSLLALSDEDTANDNETVVCQHAY